MRVLKQDGFSMIEIMIASGVASLVLLMLAQMLANQFKATRTLELRSAARDLVEDMVGILNNRDNCQASLVGKNPNNATPTQILVQQPQGPIVRYTTASPGNEIGPLKIKLTGIRLNTNSTKGVPPIGNQASGTALLTLSFSLGSSVVGGATYEAERRISVVTDGTGNISTCSTTLMDKQMAQYFCSTLRGTWNPAGNNGSGECGNLIFNGDLQVSGRTTLRGDLQVSGRMTVQGGLTVDGGEIEIK
jgi:prepilin-type N-terminal cleavage/methylation domain-containing protein